MSGAGSPVALKTKPPQGPPSPQLLELSKKKPVTLSVTLGLYGGFAAVCIRAKWITLAVAIGLFFWAVTLPFEMENFPTDIRDQFAVLVRLPETATIEPANEKASRLKTSFVN